MPFTQKKLSRCDLLTGPVGEEIAAEYLIKQGYRIVERNYRTPIGEVDIIALDGKTLVFVEVKSRSGPGFGLPQFAVDFRKQSKISYVALAYLRNKKISNQSCRFDVVAILKKENGFKVDLIRNAFDGVKGT